jgi:hypothetical protein
MACEIPWGFDLITTKAQQNAMQRQLEGSRFCVAGETVVCAHSDWKPCEIAPDGTALPTMSWREIKSEDMTHCLPSAGRR